MLKATWRTGGAARGKLVDNGDSAVTVESHHRNLHYCLTVRSVHNTVEISNTKCTQIETGLMIMMIDDDWND